MLSRFAENAFWMGRYMVRTESLARLLSVTEAFAADQDSEAAWRPVIEVYQDSQTFAARKTPFTALGVARFYLADRANPNAIISALTYAKENARSLRHLISTESWRQLSVFHVSVSALTKRRFSLSKLSDICEEIRTACFTHRGLIEATWYRDEVWLFNRLGAALERADQMTRFLDMKYFQGDASGGDAGPRADVAWWNTLLRSASGYHAFHRRHSVDVAPSDAATFLLFDLQFPRSVRGAATTAFTLLDALDRDFHASPGPEVKDAARALAERLKTPPAKLAGRALHRYLDETQRDI
ncbi:MAG: alpha-E domain-containing protein, partial [Amphiplicatus sp.]